MGGGRESGCGGARRKVDAEQARVEAEAVEAAARVEAEATSRVEAAAMADGTRRPPEPPVCPDLGAWQRPAVTLREEEDQLVRWQTERLCPEYYPEAARGLDRPRGLDKATRTLWCKEGYECSHFYHSLWKVTSADLDHEEEAIWERASLHARKERNAKLAEMAKASPKAPFQSKPG